MRFAGFWSRILAYHIDIVPIVTLTAALFYVFFGFDETWQAYRREVGNIEVRAQFLAERNRIRDLAFVLWLIYSTVMEASPWQGTVGKAALGLRVVDQGGNRLTLRASLRRNVAKLLSYLSLGLGFLWVAFSKEKRAWHDMAAKTFVIHANTRKRAGAG